MGIFDKIFGNKSTPKDSEKKERGKFMPKIKIPVDELFTTNFIHNGGKFLYSPTIESVFENFKAIIKENDWDTQNILCYNENLKKRFNQFNLNESKDNTPSFFLTSCESLIADKGSILISSNQIKEQKIDTLPNNFILFATTSQLKETISDGLKSIKKNSKKHIPTNITTLKHFKISEEEKDFLTYGSSTKNLYLLLLEDL